MLSFKDVTFAFVNIYLQCKIYSVHNMYTLQILSEVEETRK